MKAFSSLMVGMLLAATVASADEAKIEVITVTAKYPPPAAIERTAIEEIIVVGRQSSLLTPDKVEPATPVELPSLDLKVAAAPEAQRLLW